MYLVLYFILIYLPRFLPLCTASRPAHKTLAHTTDRNRSARAKPFPLSRLLLLYANVSAYTALYVLLFRYWLVECPFVGGGSVFFSRHFHRATSLSFSHPHKLNHHATPRFHLVSSPFHLRLSSPTSLLLLSSIFFSFLLQTLPRLAPSSLVRHHPLFVSSHAPHPSIPLHLDQHPLESLGAIILRPALH